MKQKDLKVALVYDWVDTRFGGAEQVLVNLHQIFPQAPLYTSIYNPDKALWAKDLKVIPSFLQKLPKIFFNHKLLVFLLGLAFESFDFSDFDLVISVSSGPAKAVITTPEQLHINYCLTPPRYLFTHKDRYQSSFFIFRMPIFKQIFNLGIRYLKWWDISVSSRPDQIIPISQVVKKRVETIYKRKTADIIYPPVEIISNTSDQQSKDFYLVVSRLVPYKKIDVAIKACDQLNKKLIIIGEGEQRKKLERMSSNKIKFLGNVSSQRLSDLYNQARALIMVGEEDFGITGLEALSFGVPVLVNKSSGVAELILNSTMGVHLPDEEVKSLKESILKLEQKKFDKKILKRQAKKFGQKNFKQNFYQQCMMMYDNYKKLD